MAASEIKENVYQLQEDLFITWLYRIQYAKNWHATHPKCVKNKFHNRRTDTEPSYKSKSSAIYVLEDLHLADDGRI